jgi:hypothetical protein
LKAPAVIQDQLDLVGLCDHVGVRNGVARVTLLAHDDPGAKPALPELPLVALTLSGPEEEVKGRLLLAYVNHLDNVYLYNRRDHPLGGGPKRLLKVSRRSSGRAGITGLRHCRAGRGHPSCAAPVEAAFGAGTRLCSVRTRMAGRGSVRPRLGHGSLRADRNGQSKKNHKRTACKSFPRTSP